MGVAALRCLVEDTRSGARWEVPLANDASAWPHCVGAGEACSIRLDDPAIGACEVKVVASGMHFAVEALGSAGLRVRGEPVPPGKGVRVDGPFEVGPYRLELGFPGEPYED